MDPLSAIILGLVQAFTEFLPVSSSGHLVLAHHLLAMSAEGGVAAEAFAVAVHFGTLLSVVVVFRDDVMSLLRSLWRAGRSPGTLRRRWSEDSQLRLAGAIVLGCIPAGVVGLVFKDRLEAAFNSVTVVGFALLFTGLVLLGTLWAPRGARSVNLRSSVWIGLAQAVAIIPGVSRSGSTIAVAMFLGIEREQAAKYSFLLSLPVIAGASGLTALELLNKTIPSQAWLALGLGSLVAFLAGIIALKLLMAVVKQGAFAHFGWYCLAMGTAGLAL